MNTQLPSRVQEQLQAAEALEAADKAARASSLQPVSNAADLIAPLTSPTSAPPRATPATAATTAVMEDLQQKYKTLQGMYAADVTNLKGQLKAVADRVQVLTAKESAPATDKPAVNPKDIENFGQEMMEMVQRYVTGVATQLESRLGRIESQLGSVEQQTAATREEQFYTLLTKLVPNWRAVNADDKWLLWLGVRDDVYGLPRQAALDNAFKNGNAQQVANVFNAFINSAPTVKPAPSLESQIAPESAGNPVTPAAASKPILSEKAITSFYNDMSRGKYAGRETESSAIEEQINLAVAEGRVR